LAVVHDAITDARILPERVIDVRELSVVPLRRRLDDIRTVPVVGSPRIIEEFPLHSEDVVCIHEHETVIVEPVSIFLTRLCDEDRCQIAESFLRFLSIWDDLLNIVLFGFTFHSAS